MAGRAHTVTGTWLGVPVQVLRIEGFWVTVRFLESCDHYGKGSVACLSRVNILCRTPIRVTRTAV